MKRRQGFIPRLTAFLLLVALWAPVVCARENRIPDPYQGPMAALLTRRSHSLLKHNRAVDIEHMVLRLRIDERRRFIRGSVTYTIRPFDGHTTVWTLDRGPDLIIDRVTFADGRPIEFQTYRETLTLTFPAPLPVNQPTEVTIAYHGSPRKGLYFIHPDKGDPARPVQVWSQGEAEDNHFWFPTHDFPNERFTTETYFTVRKPFQAISNGRLIEVTDGPEPGWHTWHWKIATPHVAYLVSVAVGEFNVIKDDFDGTPVLYYIPKIYPVEWGRRAFGRTPDMMRFYSEVTGYRYPYEKYAQVAVEMFIFGGMENISATTQTARTLRDDIAAREGDSDGLVAHELAHQWFGDLITCESWAHTWLNEGFATYFTALWFEHDRGRDAFDWNRFNHQQSYLAESRRYMRPLNWNFVTVPMDLFDRHTYPKGAMVLHQLRTLLGDELFWKGLRHYVKKYAGQTVEASDFQNAMEEATGRALDWYFDQWVNHAGHPELKIEHVWDPEHRQLTLKVRQVQKINAWVPLFRLPTRVRVVDRQGKIYSFPVTIEDEFEVFRFQLEAPPKLVLLDPGRNWMTVQTWDKDEDELIVQLKEAESVIDRAWAAKELQKKGGRRALAALVEALQKTTFVPFRVYLAGLIGEMKTEAARDQLASMLDEPEPRVRAAIIRSLAECPADADVAKRLARIYQKDETYGVRAAIIRTLVKWQKDRARRWIERGLREKSYNNILARTAIDMMTELSNEKAVVQRLERLAEEGHPLDIRTSAIFALGKMEKKNHELTRFLEKFLNHEYYAIRSAALRALRMRRDPEASAAVERMLAHEPDDRLRVGALHFLESLERPSGEKVDLKQRIERVREELLHRIEELEEKLEEVLQPRTPATT